MAEKEQSKEIVNVRLEQGVPYDIKTGVELDPKVLKSHMKRHEIRIVDVDDNLATGIHINQYKKPAIQFLKDLENYGARSNDVHVQIDVSNKIYRFEDVAATGLEILIDFTISDYEFTGMSDELKAVVNWWDKNINSSDKSFSHYGLKNFLSELAAEFFVSGNIYPGEVWQDVVIDGNPYRLPTKIQLFNPMHVKVDPTEVLTGNKSLLFSFTGLEDNRINATDLVEDKTSIITRDNPIFMKEPLVRDNNRSFSRLNPELVSHIKRKARSYDLYGVPYLTKLSQAVTYKQKLWQLDLSTIEGMINLVTIFKIGSPDVNSPFHKPTLSRLQAFAALIKNPQASTVLTWPHDIDVITAGPDGKILNFQDKYKEANRAIIQGLGVPPILIDGSGTATAAYVTILALNKRLDLARSVLKNYVEHIVTKIIVENDIETTGKESLTWFPSSLRNESLVKQLLLAFYDRGLLPIQTTHNQGGYRHDEMIELKESEFDGGLDDLFSRPDIPFSPSPDKTPGRPSDVPTQTNPPSQSYVLADAGGGPGVSFKVTGDAVSDKYHDDVERLINGIEEDIADLKKRSKGPVDNVIDVAFVRFEQLADTFSNFDDFEFDVEFSSKLSLFHQNNINKLKDFVKSSISKLAIKKVGDEKEILIAGIISKAKSRASLFVKESLRNIELAKSLTDKRNEGFSGAIVNIPSDTECEFCREIDGNYYSLSEVMDVLPAHPHQRFSLDFVKENPRVSGKKKNKNVVQNPRNKSKKL